MAKAKLDLKNEKIRHALYKAKSAWQKAEIGQKRYALEKTFAIYAGRWLGYVTLLKYIKELDKMEGEKDGKM